MIRIGGLLALAACNVAFGLDPPPAPDAAVTIDSGPHAPMLEDDFEDGIDPRWTLSFENGDLCEATTELAASGTSSLRCRTDDRSGTRAALVFDFTPTPTLRVEMDVRFAAHPSSFLAFIQTAHRAGPSITRLVAADYYGTSQIDVWNFETEDWDYYPQPIGLDTWYHVDFTAQISSTQGSVAVTIDNGSERAELTNTNTTDLPINQLQIGNTLVRLPNEQLTVYIDNVRVSEM